MNLSTAKKGIPFQQYSAAFASYIMIHLVLLGGIILCAAALAGACGAFILAWRFLLSTLPSC